MSCDDVREQLAEHLLGTLEGPADLEVRRAWAGLRTFAPDRRPAIGPDPRLPGLVHASGLGGFGMMTSAAVGELVADLLTRRAPDWIDWCAVAPTRFAAPMGTS